VRCHNKKVETDDNDSVTQKKSKLRFEPETWRFLSLNSTSTAMQEKMRAQKNCLFNIGTQVRRDFSITASTSKTTQKTALHLIKWRRQMDNTSLLMTV
jgi:hypothetical protein